mmetsp:Transcript_40518/g.39032  ORF Transcript_40518/g.39032 Transcript_40518/m.39032 type:complete len:142 (+) Transcript_40518:2642-3067(+)
MCRNLSDDRLDQERVLAAEISFKLGKYLEDRDGNLRDAVTAYDDCLSRNEEHKEAIVAEARIFQNMGDNKKCTSLCQKLLKIDNSNDNATYMLANLMLHDGRSDQAINTYKGLLEKKPDNFNALHQLIELMRRAGRLSEIP